MENKVLVFIPFIDKDDMNYRLLEMSGLLDSLLWDREFIGFKINVIRHGTYFNEDRINEIQSMIKELHEKELVEKREKKHGMVF